MFCVWDCCWYWIRIQEIIGLIVFDPFMELFITLCIVVNTLFMAMDHHDMDKDFDNVLKKGNYVSVFDQASGRVSEGYASGSPWHLAACAAVCAFSECFSSFFSFFIVVLFRRV